MTRGSLQRVYLDHNATSPLRPEAAEAMTAALADVGNPSSVHAEGRRAKARLESARETVAEALGARADNVVLTSGATEAVNLAVLSTVASGCSRLLLSAVEHDSVREAAAASGAAVELLPVTRAGALDLAALGERLQCWDEADGRPFLALMHANNETGAIQPVAEAARLVREKNGLVLVDAAQTLGKIPVDLGALYTDYIAASAHKLGGPVGAGALALGADAPLARRQHGGGQERGRRAGTENLLGSVGFAAALEAALADKSLNERLGRLRDDLEAKVRARRPDAQIWGAGGARLGTTSSMALPGFRGETQVMALDLAGVAVSAGSACSSGKVKASHVLKAMGADDALAGSAIRVSLGWSTTEADIERCVAAYVAAAERAVGPARVPALGAA